MVSQLGFNSGSSIITQLPLLLILLLLLHLAATQDSAAASALDEAEQQQQLRAEADLQSPTSWLHSSRHWLPVDDSSDGCQPPMLWAPNGQNKNRSSSTVPKNPASQQQQTQGGASSSAVNEGASGSGQWLQLGQDESGGAAAHKTQREEDFTCKDDNNEVVSWFIVVKEHGSFNYVYATSANPTFSTQMENIHSSGPLYKTLKQTGLSDGASLFYSYTSFNTTPNEGHQNGVLLFGRNTGFWLIHSWRRFFEYFSRGVFPPLKKRKRTKGQTFLCTTHQTASDLEKIGQQLSVTKPHQSQITLTTGEKLQPKINAILAKESFPTWISISNGNFSDQASVMQTFAIGLGNQKTQLRHYAKPVSDDTDIYRWIANNNSINGSSSCLMVQSWHSSGNQEGAVWDVEAHTYPNMQPMSPTTDHSKWCVPRYKTIGPPKYFVCIGDLNRLQPNRPGGAMCLWNKGMWDYFENIGKEKKK